MAGWWGGTTDEYTMDAQSTCSYGSKPLSAAAVPYQPPRVFVPMVKFSEFILESRKEQLTKYLFWSLSLAMPLPAHEFDDNTPLRQSLFRYHRENPESFTITADLHSNRPDEPLHMSITHKMLYTDVFSGTSVPQINTIHINFWPRTPIDLRIISATCRSYRDGVPLPEQTIIKRKSAV